LGASKKFIHPLRTPLNAIIGYGEMVQEELEEIGVKDVIPDLQRVQAAAKHQLGLVNEILDLSKIEVGNMTLFVEEFDVDKLVREVEATVQLLIAKNGNSIGWTWTVRLTSPPCVPGDRGRAFTPSRLPSPPPSTVTIPRGPPVTVDHRSDAAPPYAVAA